MRSRNLLPLLLLTSYGVSANQQISDSLVKEKVQNAMTQMQQTERKNWAYQISHYENEEGEITQSIESFNPLRPDSEHWMLLSIGGKPPTVQQQQEFMAEKNEPEDNDQNNLKVKLEELIQLQSIQVKEVNSTEITASFDVYLERLGTKASKSLTGLLRYDREQKFVSEIQITNKDLFSPVLTAEISEFQLSLSFKKLHEQILPHEKNMQMKGSFAFFTEIDEVSTVTYSNYQYVGKANLAKD